MQQVQQPLAALPEHRRQIAQREPDVATVAEQQLNVVGQRDPGCRELIGVRRELEQSLRPLVPGELGIADAVGVAVADHEVGEPVEAAVEERRLADKVGAGLERREGLAATLGQDRGRVGLGVVDEADAAARRRVIRRQTLAQASQLAGFVLKADLGDAVHQGVDGGLGRRDPSQLHVELTEQGELALRCPGEVAGRPQDVAVRHDHRLPFAGLRL